MSGYRHSPPPKKVNGEGEHMKDEMMTKRDDWGRAPVVPPSLGALSQETGTMMTGASNRPAVGDVNSAALGSGARFNAGKPALECIPLHLLEGAARVFDKVTKRPVNPYPKWNWAKGMPWSVPIGCIKRHLAALERGEDVDPETGERHISHILCNVVMLEHYYNNYPEGDDRSDYFLSRAEQEALDAGK